MDPHNCPTISKYQSMTEFSNGINFGSFWDHGTSNLDASEQILRDIEQALMEEITENEAHALQESLELQAKERSFYEVLGQIYPPSSSSSSVQESDPPNGSGYHVLNVISESRGKLCVDDEKTQKRPHGGKKTYHTDRENDCQERSNKLPVVYTESIAPVEEYDDILIHTLCQITISEEGQNGRNGVRITKQKKKKQVIDLESLLINCSQSVAAKDFLSANELLKQIRQHSSPFGDRKQRLAHYFADGIEGRLAGTGSQIYKALVYKDKVNLLDCMKAYCNTLAFSSLRKISNFACNELIMIKLEKAKALHIIDFGIQYGFQWPAFIKRLGELRGNTPRLRITGIEFPQKHSQPVERIMDTGQWLARYAKMFNVPFEYHVVTQEWETIKVEDLKIVKGEFVAVNCMYRAMMLSDEAISGESSRDIVFNLIRKINPDIFIHGIINGAYGSGTFVSRFLDLLLYSSAIFDMLETIIPTHKTERLVFECALGKSILNVVACEGRERVERPETYKKWHKQHFKADFMPIPFERKLMDTIMHKVTNFYHREFTVHEDNYWLLVSWKGRIMVGVSCWKPILEI